MGRNSIVNCIFHTTSEHDMDVLFLNAFATDTDFLQLFLGKTEWSEKTMRIVDIELSKTDSEFGESDITVILEFEGKRYALLIEDKIDAVAMPEQHQRYLKRGDKAVVSKEYQEYKVFIVCPEKYYNENREAQKYEYYVSYEECAEYFKAKEDIGSNIRFQQISQSIRRAKRSPQVILNEQANEFFRRYREYQAREYPHLDLRTRESSNGWWVRYGTRYKNTYIDHKQQEGYVDLLFPNAAGEKKILDGAFNWFNQYHKINAYVVAAQKSAVIRVNVPKLLIKEIHFEDIDALDLQRCFDAISTLSAFAGFLRDMEYISSNPNRKS